MTLSFLVWFVVPESMPAAVSSFIAASCKTPLSTIDQGFGVRSPHNQWHPFINELWVQSEGREVYWHAVDFVVFGGLAEGGVAQVVFVEVKSSASNLTSRERQVRDAVQAGRVRWQELRVAVLSARIDCERLRPNGRLPPVGHRRDVEAALRLTGYDVHELRGALHSSRQ